MDFTDNDLHGTVKDFTGNDLQVIVIDFYR